MKNVFVCVLGILMGAGFLESATAQVVISEFMASNQQTLADQDGEYTDWIELFNSSSAPVNLQGWSLTDNSSLPAKWVFPAVSLSPKSFMVIFASGKNRTTAGSELHANFSLNSAGEYLGLFRPDGTVATQYAPQYPEQYDDISYGSSQDATVNTVLATRASSRFVVPQNGTIPNSWVTTGFDDSSWTRGFTGLGYESAVAGFAVRNIKANVVVGSLTDAEGVISNVSRQSKVTAENTPVLNFFGTGQEAHYVNNLPFPGNAIGVDIEDFVIEATGTITIPAAGEWTFGVNSDDGFGLSIGSFRLSFPAPRGPADTLGTFNVPAAGEYPVRLVFFERGGGAGLEFFAAKGNFTTWDATRFRLVGDIAGGGLAVKSTPAGSATSGSLSYRALINTDVQAQMHNRNASLYLRVPFTVTNTALEALTLKVKYDDGFVAYLNGQEVARRNAPATLEWNSAATADRPASASLTYEEIGITEWLSLLRAGSNVLAVHALNQSASDGNFLILPELVEYKISSLADHYFSTATPTAPNAAGFLAFVGDTRFSHDRGFYSLPFDLTITTETPGAVIRYTTNGLPPTLAVGTTYAGPIRIGNTTVFRARAFKDGFEPSNIDTHTYLFLDDVIRQSPTGQAPPGWPASWGANVVDYGMDPDVVNNPAYSSTIKNDLKTLPSFSIVMDVKDLFDPARGIYANPGQDGRDWERPTSVELINPDGTKGFQIDAGIRIRGGFSRSTSNPKHAFRFFFRKDYGEAKLKYPLFGDSGTDTFDAIDLRTFQNYSWSFQGDSRGVFLRDQFSRDAQLAMGHQAERGNFYHLYINGQYWGLFNTCERPEASYGATYYGGAKEDYDVIKVEAGPYTINATDGDLNAWTQLYNLGRAGFATDAAYQRVQGNNPDGTRNPLYPKLVDIPNLIDYMLVIIYGGNLDAPISNFLGNSRPNNWYGLRNRIGPDGFRFFAHDAEHTLLDLNQDRTGPFSAGDTSITYSNPQWVMKQLAANPEFRMTFADHVQRHLFNDGVLTPNGARVLFMARKNEIDRAVVGESARWGDAKRATPFTRNVEWLNSINNILNNYFPRRTGIVINQLRTDGLYPAVTAPAFSQHGGAISSGYTLSVSAPAGTIYYTRDGSDPRLKGGGIAPSALVYNSPITLAESTRIKSRVQSAGAWSALNEAEFTIIQTFKDLLITEIMYNPPAEAGADGDEFEFVELKNVSSTELDLSGVHFTNGIVFRFPNGTRLGAGQFAVLASNSEQFQKKYPNARLSGVYTGRLANGGETLTLNHAVGTEIMSVSFSDQSPWPTTADGAGFSLVPVNPNLNPAPNDPLQWRASSRPGGSPGADDPGLNLPTVWITEILTHTDPPQIDAIELHNPTAQPADVSHWLLTDQRAVPNKFRIPPGSVIPPGGHLVFSETQFNPQPGVPPSFTLNSHGEEIFLFSADATGKLTGYSDGFSFGAAANGVSFGRYTTTAGDVEYPAQLSNTFGQPNSGPRIGPIVINEIQYFPANGDAEFIELKNITSSPVALFDPQFPTNRWRLNGVGFEFPANTQIAANGLVLVVATDPASFRSRHSVPASVPIFGPYTGTLQDNGEMIELQRPDSPDVDPPTGIVTIPYIDIDAVRFNDKAPWPTGAAGTGPSLERVSATTYGNEPSNWRASPGTASPGFENRGNRVPQVNAGFDLAIEASNLPAQTNITGVVTDDGAAGSQLNISWTQVTGPATASFSPANQAATTVTFPSVGTYVLRLTANDGELSASDELTVTVQRVATQLTVVPAGAVWKYYDKGTDLGSAWRSPGFNDSAWASGRAQLGYGDGDEVTVIGFGPNSGAKYITSYFRHAFSVSNPKALSKLMLRLLRDDGAVVYLNGVEVFRSNMPEGDITFNTVSSGVVGDADESNFFEKEVDSSLLVTGSNLLAVEIHQTSGTSSDTSFDLALIGVASATNEKPSANAGPDLSARVNTDLPLAGAAADDGLPVPPGKLTTSWSQVSGPATAVFNNNTLLNPIVRFPSPGVYVLRLTASDGELSATDDVQVTVTSETGTLAEWKGRYFSAAELNDPAISGDSADPDADGHSNIQEFTAGTDPRDSQSVLKLLSAATAGAPTRFRFLAMPGKTYSVLSTDTIGGAPWTVLAQVPAQSSVQTIEITDPNVSSRSVRYYRVVTPAQP